jgi:hypothetical protein
MNIKKLVVVLLFAAIACKPGVKNETNKRDVNIKNIESYSIKYSNLKPLIDGLRKNYDAAWAEAEKLTNEEEKAKKMSEANDMIYKDPVFSRLSSFDTKYKSLEEDSQKLASQKIDKKFSSERSTLLTNTAYDLNEAKTIVLNAKPDNAELAAEEIKKANGVLISSNGRMDSFEKKIKGKKK